MNSADRQAALTDSILTINDYCCYKISPGRGVGVFASQYIKSDCVILRELDRRIPGKDKPALMNSKIYDFLFVDRVQFNKQQKTSDLHVVFGAISIVNHAEQPNSAVRWMGYGDLPVAELFAIKEIAPGEEIFHKYENVDEYQAETFI